MRADYKTLGAMMNNLVIDMTHGGVKIAVSLAKKGKYVIAYDLYSTLDDIDAQMLQIYDVDLIQLEDLIRYKGDMNVIYPIHMPLTFSEIESYNPELNYTFQSHHEAVKDILNGCYQGHMSNRVPTENSLILEAFELCLFNIQCLAESCVVLF